MKPSTSAVLDLLRVRGPRGLSDLEALAELRNRRLATAVYELRRDGFDITTNLERHAGGSHARYVLRDQSQLSLRLSVEDGNGDHPLARSRSPRSASATLPAGSRSG